MPEITRQDILNSAKDIVKEHLKHDAKNIWTKGFLDERHKLASTTYTKKFYQYCLDNISQTNLTELIDNYNLT